VFVLLVVSWRWAQWRVVGARVEWMASWGDRAFREASLLRGQACAVPERELGRPEWIELVLLLVLVLLVWVVVRRSGRRWMLWRCGVRSGERGRRLERARGSLLEYSLTSC